MDPFSFHSSALPQAPQITELDKQEGSGGNKVEGMWPDRILSSIYHAELHSWTIDAPRAMAIVYAGGGYTKLMYDKEGVEIALWLNSMQIDAHLLVHRLPGADNGSGGHFPKDISLKDGMLAMDALSERYPSLPLFHVGLSSGGHLSGTMACQTHKADVRGALIAYAPINANHRNHKYPSDKPDYPPVEKQDFYDDWPIGLEDHKHGLPACPLFLAYALHDQSVPVQHALRLIDSASRNDMTVDAHIFGSAPHGFALRDSSGSHAYWPQLAKDWLSQQL